MRGTSNSDTSGRFIGRAVTGVSKLTLEDLGQIEAHRAKDRPTPWPHLAVRYGVNEIDLRQMFEVKDERPAPLPVPAPRTAPPRAAVTARDASFTTLWNAGTPKTDIALALGVHLLTVDKMRDRLGLAKRDRSLRDVDWTPADAAYVRENYILGGKTAASVGKHLGRTRCAVIGLAHRQGWSRYKLRRAEPAAHPDCRP